MFIDDAYMSLKAKYRTIQILTARNEENLFMLPFSSSIVTTSRGTEELLSYEVRDKIMKEVSNNSELIDQLEQEIMDILKDLAGEEVPQHRHVLRP